MIKNWHRDEGPCIGLGVEGTFDDMHLFASCDGIEWDPPSDSQLEHVYAPTLIKEDDCYKLRYTYVRALPWSIRYAQSADGGDWQVAPDPVLKLDQSWENDRPVYPTVVSIDGEYWMWYGSYSQYGGEEMKTATGCAYNTDGLSWQKDPDNPVFGPDPSRPGNRTTRPANRYCASQMVPSASGTLRARHPLSSTSILP